MYWMRTWIWASLYSESIRFFRVRLLYTKNEDVGKLIDDHAKEVRAIKESAFQLSWYMRGAVSYEDVLNMSNEERTDINKLIEKNLETTKKSGLPFF